VAVRKLGGKWTIEFELRKHRVFRRLPAGATKAQAQEYESKLRSELIDQAYIGRKPNVPLDYAIKCWLEEEVKGRKAEKETRSKAKQVRADEEGESLDRICDVAQRIRERHSLTLSVATINRRLCILKAVAKFAWRKGWAAENLSGKIRLIPGETKRDVYLSQAQVNALIKAAPSSEPKAFIAIAAYTGLRQGEVMALLPDDIRQEGLVVRDSKSGDPRIVPYLGPKRHLKAIPFTRHKRTLYAEFEAAAETLGLPYKLRYHDLRHTVASQTINAGASLYDVGEVLGHKSTQTTKRYAHLSTERKREALRKAFPKPIKNPIRKSGPGGI
jgi:integrase